MSYSETVRRDFDRLAHFDQDGWSHNQHYHPYLLRHAPAACDESLDIGCGTGSFARLLAARSRHVLGLDLSPEMIRLAQARSGHFPNVDYQIADVLTLDLPANHFDCIASIATLHHLPLDVTLAKIKAALNPGGVLLVLDLFKAESVYDFAKAALAFPANITLRLIKTGRLRESAEVRAAWDEHGKTDKYLTLSEVRRACAKILPGAQIRSHLLWRYSLVWRKSK